MPLDDHDLHFEVGEVSQNHLASNSSRSQFPAPLGPAESHGGPETPASSTAINSSVPVELAVIPAIFLDMEFNIDSPEPRRGYAPPRRPSSEGVAMRTFMHARNRHDSYFHPHPFHTAFSLIASLALAVLIVLALATAAR